MARTILRPIGRGARQLWRHLPPKVLASRPMRRVGSFIYDHYVRDVNRYQSHSTHFMRNVPQLEVLRNRLAAFAKGETLRIASIGCSTGAELYSLLWVFRSTRPDLKLVAHGVDISAEVVEVARRGIYHPGTAAAEGSLYLAGQPDLFTEEIDSLGGILEVAADGSYHVRDWVRKNTEWFACDATDPALAERLPLQDLVLANNFMGPMGDELAERCFRNVARLVKPGGCLVVDGIDLRVKERAVLSLGLVPVTSRIEDIHAADPTKRDWPWIRWSHEPLDRTLPHWESRYATIFTTPSSLA